MDEEVKLRRRIARLGREQAMAYDRRRQLIMAAVDNLVTERTLARVWGISQPRVNLIVRQEMLRRGPGQAPRQPLPGDSPGADEGGPSQ